MNIPIISGIKKESLNVDFAYPGVKKESFNVEMSQGVLKKSQNAEINADAK